VPRREDQKTPATVALIHDAAFQRGWERGSVIVALAAGWWATLAALLRHLAAGLSPWFSAHHVAGDGGRAIVARPGETTRGRT